jgi:hypothetical protein
VLVPFAPPLLTPSTVGEVADIVTGGVDLFGSISKIVDVASLAKTIDESSELFGLLGNGLRDEEEIATAAEGVEEAMSTEAFATRGKLGTCISKVQGQMLQCADNSIENYVMDTVALGQSLDTGDTPSKRSLLPQLYRRDTIFELFEKRAPAPTCIFEVAVRIV